MLISDVKTDCRYFKGHIPCKFNKTHNVRCTSGNSVCSFYDKTDKKILIIKLGAIGDVIRTTPLFSRLKKENPSAKFYWLTLTPDIVPAEVDLTLKLDLNSSIYLQEVEFDIAINLDKDYEACALFNRIKANKKFGFSLVDGFPTPTNQLAEHKYLTGIFDDLNQQNKKNYLEEIFEICDLDFQGEKYTLDSFDDHSKEWEIDYSKKIVGLNTGCGGRWTSRLWPEKYWIELAKKLIAQGYEVIFLGGELEDEKNKRLSEQSGGKYFGTFPLKTFINLVNQVDLVVTAVTMAMHITLGLNKKIVLFNNIFNKHEFELYGLGKIIEPEKECNCFFSAKCSNNDYECMDFLYPSKVLSSVNELLLK
ncbi:MAG: glycosyltransferase family 9 protein [Bacteroidota bacterium]